VYSPIVGWLPGWQTEFMVDQQPSLHQTRRVVIIDDEPALGKLLTKMVSSLGHDVVFKADTRASHTYEIRDNDIVFVDVLMPHVNGIQVLEQLARQNLPAAIVLMSGDGRSLDEAVQKLKKLDLRLAGVLYKPFRLVDVETVLESL
jgi:DNA-binding NtrC family response regulator